MTLDTITAVKTRRSVRRYKADAIPREDLLTILEAGRQAPSAGNRQPWHFVVVADEDLKVKVAETCNSQRWMAEAALIIAGISLPQASAKWHMVDVAIAMENMILAATSLGYGTCWIGAFREGRVKELLHTPPEMKVVALTPLGVPATIPVARRRKDREEIFSLNRYGQALSL